MITLETLRIAALSPQPWDELDVLVRAELSAGRLTKEIYEEIRGLQNAVRETPGFSEDANDAIGDTLDALIGFCSADREYKNPPILPSEDEIAKLPCWARVAFAARCARRVLPLFALNWPDAPRDYFVRLKWGMELAESTATYAGQGIGGIASRGAIACAAYICDAVINAKLDHARVVEVINAIKIASERLEAPHAQRGDYEQAFINAIAIIEKNASTALANGIATSRETYEAAQLTAYSLIRRDFDPLAKLAQWQHWTDDTPVPPEVFGPLWPEGPPKSWPVVTDALERTGLTFDLSRTTVNVPADGKAP